MQRYSITSILVIIIIIKSPVLLKPQKLWSFTKYLAAPPSICNSTSLHFAARPSLPFQKRLWPSLQVLATPFSHQSYPSNPLLTPKDHFNQMVCHILSEEYYHLSLEHNIPLRAYQSCSVRNDLSSLTPRLTAPPQTEIYISKCDNHYLSISI